MSNINLGRLLLGGLVAGLVLNIGEYLLNDRILATQMLEFFRRCGVPLPGGSFLAIAVVMTFVLGIAIVFLYAAIRQRFGPGPKTALIAALIAWLLVCVYGNVIGAALGFVPVNVLLIVIVWCLVEYSLGAIAGGWVYKEEGS